MTREELQTPSTPIETARLLGSNLSNSEFDILRRVLFDRDRLEEQVKKLEEQVKRFVAAFNAVDCQKAESLLEEIER